MLTLNNVHIYYGRIHAVKGISFEAREGEITALIGANGAGKSTTIKSICGLIHPQQGEISMAGEPIQSLASNKLVRRGVGYVPEGRRIFPVLTLEENLEMGAYHRQDTAEVEKDKTRMFDMFPALKGREKQLAGSLSGGEQQMLAIARALMCRPKILIMDEPSLGLAPMLVQHVFDIISELNRQGITVLLSEQNARGALKIAHHGIVLETGKVRFADSAASLRENRVVQQAYLGAA